MKMYLDKYISEEIKATGQPFALLTDNLHQLCNPMDYYASTLLSKIFLDKPNRYLVISTQLSYDSLNLCPSNAFWNKPQYGINGYIKRLI